MGGNAGGHFAPLGGVVAQAQHGQRIAHAGKAHTNAALGSRLGALLLQGPESDVEHVVQCTHLGGDRLLKGFKVKCGQPVKAKWVADKTGQNDRTQIATAIRRQGLLAARVGGLNFFAIPQVVVLVHVVQEQNAGLGKVVGGLHHGVPQLARGHGFVDPQAIGTLGGTLGHDAGTGLGAVHQLPVFACRERFHERIRHTHRHVEVIPAPGRALGRNKFHHIGVVNAQHTHLGATACTGTFHGGAGLVEHVDVATRPRSHGGCGLDFGTTRTDAGKIVTHAAAAAHRFCGFAQGFVNAGVAFVIHTLNAVAHGLHKTVDQGGLNGGTGGAHDAPGTNGTGVQIV